MVSWDWNSSTDPRKVQCPMCDHDFISRREYCQCSIKECRFRFIGDDNLFKTSDDRLKERHKQDKELQQLLAELEKFYSFTRTKIQRIRQQLKPLEPPLLINESSQNANENL